MTGQHLVIVTGGRSHAYPGIVHSNLSALYVKLGPFTLFHGACRDKKTGEMIGADRYADDWGSTAPDVTVRPFEADWDRYRKSAGPIRNRWMVSEGVRQFPREMIHGLAFPEPGSKGTVNCIEVMEEFGIDPDVWDYDRIRRWQSSL